MSCSNTCGVDGATNISNALAGGLLGRLAASRLAASKSALSRIFALVVVIVGAYVTWHGMFG